MVFISLSIEERIIITIILSIVTLIGIIGNLLVCIIFKGRRRVRQIHASTRSLIISLGFVDMIISMNNIPYILSVNNIDLMSNNAMCQISGFANIGLVLISIWLIVIISINRAAIVTNSSNFFTINKTLAYICSVCVVSCVFGIAPILGWSKYIYQQSRLVCTVIFLNPVSFSVAYLILFELCPGVFIVYSTYIIIKLKRRNLRRILAFDVTNRGTRLQQDTRQTMMLLVVIFAFVVCFLPDFAIKRALRGNKVKPLILALSTVLRLLNHAINPIIYGLLNKDFRRSLFVIGKSIFTLDFSGTRI